MTPPAMSRTVMIIDDHQVVSLGVRSALLDAGVADDALWLPAVDPARIPTGAVVVLDLRLNDDSSPRDNITALSGAGHPVVVYTSAENPCLVREAIAAGALAIVRKSAPVDELVDAVRAAADGEAVPGPDWASALAHVLRLGGDLGSRGPRDGPVAGHRQHLRHPHPQQVPRGRQTGALARRPVPPCG